MVVTTAEALLMRLPAKRYWEINRLKFVLGQSNDLKMCLHTLVNMGYESVDMVESKGHFSLRGGILDIYAPNMEDPIRIEFFDDEVDSIRAFDPSTQLSQDKMERVEIGPCREVLLDDEVRKRLSDKLTKRISTIKNEELVAKLKELKEHVNEEIYVDGLDRYFDLMYEEDASLMNFLAKRTPIFISEPSRTHERADRYINDYKERFKNYFERGALLADQVNNIFGYDRVLGDFDNHPVILMDNLTKRIDDFRLDQIIHFQSVEAPLFHGKNKALAEELIQWQKRDYHTVLAVSGEEKAERLKNILIDYDVSAIVAKDIETAVSTGQVIICPMNLSHGFILRDIRYAVLTDKELSGVHRKKRKKRKTGQLIKSFNELSVGDFVVHEAHGIGKYVGIEQLVVDSQKKDYMRITYSGDDVLYIPVENMDLIQKYIGNESAKTKLSKLGGAEWKRAKAKAQKSIEDMTDELLAIYAARHGRVGYAFGADTEWQKQFEDMFPYEETPDQLKCIREIKVDMEKPAPMERLLCGDVGYGKTEVAIRAIFKAVMDSKQVALLVPTTLLAQQHYDRLKARFSKFPVKVEMLSRFRTAKQQEKITEDLRAGVLDVVVGTHRVLSNDVQYKDLGLLVIDEEQRFGVKHKEKIKKLKESVDVLSLTATPIPRTLHMSMIGIRDMSLIEDPPEDRYPVQTYVTDYDENLIAEGIEREIDRGGQVFFVHNRVSDIDQVTARLQKLVPDAKIRFAHGQMSEVKLEKMMMNFLNHEFDVLVCTTIIETGLDISNVNTIIINDADKMGLSQLYQLRGRVGRSNRIAYAYLTYARDKVLTEVAEKRLKAVKEFTELGSGFKIAMRDLEIRGAGNILGAAQSGHMATVGYEMFVKMLEEKVRDIKGEVSSAPVDTLVEYNISAYIPDTFVTNPQHKLELYKRISSIRDQSDAFAIEEEIEDRYGTLPTVVYNLIRISYLKALGIQSRILLIKEEGNTFRFEFRDAKDLKAETIALVTQKYGRRIHFNAGSKPYFQYRFLKKAISRENKLLELITVMEDIVGFQNGQYEI
ncbi:transcription-repair coupling factor [Fusibacter sp. JL216-2]|uniref:transcription-repair coupling factor n=1 Tax=Fusibacter sp. JL216-2 TaxID=3071453 RepID=UPI003D346478